jgi:hypothetical protein
MKIEILNDGQVRITKGRNVVVAQTRDDYIWETEKGESLYVSEMNTTHLFNAFRMLWNNTLPSDRQVGKYVHHPEVDDWSQRRVAKSLQALAVELLQRELPIEQHTEFEEIIKAALELVVAEYRW